MDRIQFIGLTRSGNHVSIDDSVKFFDHTIAAYELVRDVEPSSMLTTNMDDMNSSLKIQIESQDASKLNDVAYYINDTLHHHKHIYGKSFVVNAAVNDNHIELLVRAETM